MDGYRCYVEALPRQLYRVDYPGSQTIFSYEEGFKAADTTTFYGKDIKTFKEAGMNHLNWAYRGALPFISVFSDREHAENWT